MYEKVKSYIEKNNLINEEDKILIALSGGPDSICLLNLLYELKDNLNIKLGVVHINHLLRGEDANRDEEFVRSLCESMKISYYIKRIDINKYAIDNKMSSETAGRKVRYDYFEEISKQNGFNKIATAHNANDQAETVIFRLIRGSGLEGLGGIKNCRDKKIIRPILCLSRTEIEEYIKNKKLNYCIDKTNFEKKYNRNKIRLDILPYIKQNFNEDIINTLNRTALLLQKDSEFLESEASKIYKDYCIEQYEYFIIKKETFKINEAIITRILRKAVMNYSKKNCDFDMKHIYDIIDLSTKCTGKYLYLPNDIVAENVYGDIYIKNKTTNKKISMNNEIHIDKSSLRCKKIYFQDYEIECSVIKEYSNDIINLKQGKLIKYFDFDKIKNEVVIRNRLEGDKIIPIGMNGTKKVKDIFIDMKIPKEKRDIIPILCFDDKIAWILGIRTSEEYKVKTDSKNILKIVVIRKER